jgi:E3 ubiquitin-protein ligase DOA10
MRTLLIATIIIYVSSVAAITSAFTYATYKFIIYLVPSINPSTSIVRMIFGIWFLIGLLITIRLFWFAYLSAILSPQKREE